MSQRVVPLGFVVAAVLFGVGGQLHPIGSGGNIDDHLVSMFTSDLWNASHLLQMVGLLLAASMYVLARRQGVFGPAVATWLTVAAVGTAFAGLELIPHVAAASEADALRDHAHTPILDFHMTMQVLASPALGLTTAALAIAVAREARTTAAWILGAIGLVSGVASSFAGPLVVLTRDIDYSILFPFQMGVAIWLSGTGIRLARTGRAGAPSPRKVATVRA
ncbi:hypothetical protein [Nocardia caishijiensis]|uniref:DUF4386 family protein n=1 Tax=Nocardia caishijiensis TaxID=184756 RepID=A0ABQ6YIS7_9NOCA|nr:hypothetical protein [Nocardia caishijiensis]KAF0845695.1 hypothetical protein FNL39_10682 [Nocardia caishijiensis]